MTDTARLHHTGITVADLARSLAFYRDLLGMRVVMQQEKRGGYMAAVTGYPDAHVRMAQLELSPGGHRIELFEYLDRAGRGTVAEHGDVGGFHVCVVVEQLRDLHQRLAAAGVDFLSDPVPIESGANRGGLCVYALDPDRVRVELFQPPHATT